MKKLLSIVLVLTFLLSTMSGLNVMANENTDYLAFDADTSWELETAPSAMPNTIETWLKVDGTNTADRISIFGNYGRNIQYIPSIELWLGRKVNEETSQVYYLPRIEYYNVKDWGTEQKGKAFYLNNVVINPEEWYHLVVTRDSATGDIYCYLNNTLVQTVKGKAVFEDYVTEDTYLVGGSMTTPNTTYFRGNIASIAVYSDCRTASEVSSVYNSTKTSLNVAGVVDSNDTSLIAAYDLLVAKGVERIENAKKNGAPLVENMWVECEEPTDYAYSIAVLGDTQKVAENDVLNGKKDIDGIYDYVINNAESKKIKHVLGLGDITDDSREEEWQLIQNKTNQLNMSYSLIKGNHDTPKGFNTYFGEGTKYASQVAGHYGSDYENTYHKFNAGNTKYLVVALSWNPKDEVIAWANEVITAHPDYKVIITTHAYVGKDGTTIGPDEADVSLTNNNGEDLWNKLVKKHKNIVLAIGGHISNDRIMMSQVVGDNGNTVTQMLINPQGMDEKLIKAGKDPAAMVAMLYFSEDGANVDVRYYSTTRNTYFKANNQFSFSMGWLSGQKPYATEDSRNTVVMKDDEGVFYDDLVISSGLKFENFANANSNGFQLNSSNSSAINNNSGVTYVTMSLTEPDEDGINENAYGNTGKSIKVNTGATNGVVRPEGDKSIYYNSIRTNSTIDCTTFSGIEDVAISFWVKTEGPAQFSLSFWDSSTNDRSQKLYTNPIDVSAAGEYIIVVPISEFYINGISYKKTSDISSFKIINLEILFKAIKVKSNETINMYFDNIGVYPIMPNFEKAKHSSSAVVKDNMDGYVNSETNVREVTVGNDKGVWVTGNSYAVSLATQTNGDGKALCYTAKDYKYSKDSSKNLFTASSTKYIIDSLDSNGTVLGRDGTLAIWVKASRASKIVVRTNNNSSTAWLNSNEIEIPAGESIVRIPLSVYYDQDKNFVNIKKLQIEFCCINAKTNTLGGDGGYFVIDDIAIEPTVIIGDVNGDKECDIKDIVRLKKVMANAKTYSEVPSADIFPDKKLNATDVSLFRNYLLGTVKELPENLALIEHESYIQNKINNNNWVNKTPGTLTINPTTDIVRSYSGTADKDTIKVTYSSLNASTGNNFYYNSSIVTSFGENSVFCFWIYSEQSVNIKYSYMDYSNTDSKSVQCKWATITVPKGESIVEIPMCNMVPDGKDMAYKSIFQLQFIILSNKNSIKDSGEIFLDAFGFYDSSTEYELISGDEMFDNNGTTYWSPATTEKVYTGFKLENPVTFNAIDFTEYLEFVEPDKIYVNNSYVSEFVVDIKQNGVLKEVCRLDEIGERTVILDDTYTTDEFRITVTASDEVFGISEISFREISPIKNNNTFRNVGYFCSSSLDNIRERSYDKLSGYTDIILFDYGSWNENGEFLWGSMYDNINEAHLASTVSEIRSIEGCQDIDIWFCLQNYNKSITDTETLFATEESRKNLAQFAVDLCKKYNLAGIDIDYEYPDTIKAWRNYGEFLALCGSELHKNGFKFSVALSAFGVQSITADIQNNIDYVNMMVYDLYDATGRHSPYSLIRRFYTYFTELGFSSNQLVLGLPFYAKTLEVEDGKHQAGGGGYFGFYTDFSDKLLPSTNVIKSTSGKWTYYFNGADMIRDKVWFAMENNLSGVFCWSLRNDVPTDNEKGIVSLGQTVIDTIQRFSESIAD